MHNMYVCRYMYMYIYIYIYIHTYIKMASKASRSPSRCAHSETRNSNLCKRLRGVKLGWGGTLPFLSGGVSCTKRAPVILQRPNTLTILN